MRGDIRRVQMPYTSETPLKPRNDGRGYLCVTLEVRSRASLSGKITITRKVHRLVWAAFNGEYPSFHEHIDHIDHDKTNNHINNLRLRDASENSADCKKTSRKGMRVLTKEQKRMVLALAATGKWGTKALADAFGVGQTTVRRMKTQADEILGGSDG